MLTAWASIRAFRVTLYPWEEVYAAPRVEENRLRRNEEAGATIEPFEGGNSILMCKILRWFDSILMQAPLSK